MKGELKFEYNFYNLRFRSFKISTVGKKEEKNVVLQKGNFNIT